MTQNRDVTVAISRDGALLAFEEWRSPRCEDMAAAVQRLLMKVHRTQGGPIWPVDITIRLIEEQPRQIRYRPP